MEKIQPFVIKIRLKIKLHIINLAKRKQSTGTRLLKRLIKVINCIQLFSLIIINWD